MQVKWWEKVSAHKIEKDVKVLNVYSNSYKKAWITVELMKEYIYI